MGSIPRERENGANVTKLYHLGLYSFKENFAPPPSGKVTFEHHPVIFSRYDNDRLRLSGQQAGKHSMKSICLLTHRPGTSRAAFREYYETRHSRLGSRYFPFSKYVRNHLLSTSIEVDFDVITEFFFDDGVNVAGVHSGRVREIMDEDERRFMDQSLIRPSGAEEVLLAGSPRDIAAPGTRRQMLLLDRDTDEAAFRAAVADWGRALSEQHALPRVSVDYAVARAGESALPFDAVLSLWLPPAGAAVRELEAPAGVRLSADLLAEVCESTPELLRELYDPAAVE